MVVQQVFEVSTRGRGMVELTERVQDAVQHSGVRVGLCHVFLHHTSASLLITENADPDVRRDLESSLSRLVLDGDPLFRHDAEGPDDMSAHVRSVLAGVNVTLPVSGGRAALGTWQGLFLWEHRTHPHTRRVTITVLGD